MKDPTQKILSYVLDGPQNFLITNYEKVFIDLFMQINISRPPYPIMVRKEALIHKELYQLHLLMFS